MQNDAPQPQYAQHAMYPMMYGAQPAAGPADAHMYYAQMAGAAGVYSLPTARYNDNEGLDLNSVNKGSKGTPAARGEADGPSK